MELRDSFDVLAQLLRLNLDHEDAVTTSGGIVFGSLRDHSVRVSDEKQVQCILLRLSPMHRKAIQNALLISILPDLHFL